jgi:NIPSNAP protein
MSGLNLHATIKVRHGQLERFVAAMAEQVPVLTGLGWKLVGGWTSVFGRLYTVVNVWEVPDLETFMRTVTQWRESPEGQAFRAVTAEVVEEEVLTLMRSLPYAP